MECMPRMSEEEYEMYATMRDEELGMYAQNEG